MHSPLWVVTISQLISNSSCGSLIKIKDSFSGLRSNSERVPIGNSLIRLIHPTLVPPVHPSLFDDHLSILL
jgi:hypothetical protein